VITAFLTQQFLPILPPFIHRFSRRQQRKATVALIIASSIAVAIFASPAWSSYDATHPKRTGVQYMYNISSGETALHVAQLDSGPGYAEFVTKIHERYGQADDTPVKGGQEHWDILYPVSAFIESEHFPIQSNLTASEIGLPTVSMKVIGDRYDTESGFRTMTIEISHVSNLSS
jgi:hypothetical protein